MTDNSAESSEKLEKTEVLFREVHIVWVYNEPPERKMVLGKDALPYKYSLRMALHQNLPPVTARIHDLYEDRNMALEVAEKLNKECEKIPAICGKTWAEVVTKPITSNRNKVVDTDQNE